MEKASMKAHDILAELLGILSGALARVDDIDATIRAVRDTAEDIEEGVTVPAGIDRDAARTLANLLTVERASLRQLHASLCVARMHARSLAPSFKTGVQLDWLGIPRGGAGAPATKLEASPGRSG